MFSKLALKAGTILQASETLCRVWVLYQGMTLVVPHAASTRALAPEPMQEITGHKVLWT
jgi:hypothetical protein